MKTRIQSLLLTLFAGSALGADALAGKEQIVALAVDFCGGLVGEAPGAAGVASAQIIGLNLSVAKPLSQWTTDERARSGIRAALASEVEDPMRFAAFSDAPSIDSRPGAMFAVDGSACSASGAGEEDAFIAIASRLDADKRWSTAARTDTPRMATWKRTTASGGEIVFMLFNEENLTFNRVIAKSPPATAASLRPLLQSVAEQCVDGVLNGSDMNVDAFKQFYPYRRADDAGHVAHLRTFSAFPFAILNASSFRKEFFCELTLGTSDASALDLRTAIVEVVGGFQGVSRKSDSEWRIKQARKKPSAQVTTESDPRGVVRLRIKTLGGHY